MSTRSTLYLCDHTNIHVYREMINGKYYIELGPEMYNDRFEVSEALAKEFEKLEKAKRENENG